MLESPNLFILYVCIQLYRYSDPAVLGLRSSIFISLIFPSTLVPWCLTLTTIYLRSWAPPYSAGVWRLDTIHKCISSESECSSLSCIPAGHMPRLIIGVTLRQQKQKVMKRQIGSKQWNDPPLQVQLVSDVYTALRVQFDHKYRAQVQVCRLRLIQLPPHICKSSHY